MKQGMTALGKVLGLLSFALLAGPWVAGAAETSQAAITPGTRSEALPGLIREAEKGVFFIRVLDAGGKVVSTGTGFLVDAKGSVLTSLHVIRPVLATQIATAAEAIAVNGKVCAVNGVTVSDESLDLALLQLAEVPSDAVPIVLAGDELPERGTYVLAPGHPLGFRFVATDGILSAVNKTSELPDSFRENECAQTGPDVVWLQTSAAVATGNSGGPLLDARTGKALGVIQLMGRGPGLNFALHVASVREFLTRQAALVSVEDCVRPDVELKLLVRKFQRDYQHYQERSRIAASMPFQGMRPAVPAHPGAACLPQLRALADANRGKSVEYRSLETLMRVASVPDCPPTVAADVQKAAGQLLAGFRDDRRLLAFLHCRPAPTLPEARGVLRSLAEQSADAEIRALAAIALAFALEADAQGGAAREDAIKFARVAAACAPEILLGSESVATMASNLADSLTVSGIGCPAPALAGMDQTGEALTLGHLLGRYVVVAFWNKMEQDNFDGVARTLEDLAKKYADTPLALIGVGLYDAKASANPAAKTTSTTWRFIADGPDELFKKAWHITAMPTLFLLDPDGVIIGRFANEPSQTLMTFVSGSKPTVTRSVWGELWKTALTDALNNIPILSQKRLLRHVTSGPWLAMGDWDPSGPGERTVFLRDKGLTSVEWISNWEIRPPSGLHLELPASGGVDLDIDMDIGEARVNSPESLSSRTLKLRDFLRTPGKETAAAQRVRDSLLAETWDWFGDGKPETKTPQMKIRFLADGTTSVPWLPAWEMSAYFVRIFRDDGRYWTFNLDLTSMTARSQPESSQIKENKAFAADSRH